MRLAVFLTLALVVLVGGLAGALQSFNYFTQIDRTFEGLCTPVTGIPGPEDIQINTDARVAFISSRDRRKDGARGAIHIFDLTDPLNERGWRDMTGGMPEAFRPLGIDYYEDGDVRRLFVVNEAASAVEVFEVGEGGDLVHLESFTERRLNSPNNVVAVGPRSFYVTNDVRPGRNTMIGDFHFLTRQGSGQVFFVRGDRWRLAADGLRFANGIDINADGTAVYVAETAGRAVQVYDRNLKTASLTPARTIALNAAPDNLSVDGDGGVWVGALPKPLAVPAHGANPKKPAPSEVIHISPAGDILTVYRDNGAELSASTAAARMGDKLLIGALYDRKFLICDLPAGAI